MNQRHVSAIVAVDKRNAIGHGGGLLCHLPDDLRRFKQLTMGHTIIMGRHTLESFPHGPLPGRQNIVLTHNPHYHPGGVTVAHTMAEALALTSMPGEVFIIGGAQVYASALPLTDTLHLTLIGHTFPRADVFFPPINHEEWTQVSVEHHPADERHRYPFDFITLKRKDT